MNHHNVIFPFVLIKNKKKLCQKVFDKNEITRVAIMDCYHSDKLSFS